MSEVANEVRRNPANAPGQFFKNLKQLAARISNDQHFLVFFIAWLPFALTGAGFLLAFLFSRGLHVVLGALAAYLVYDKFRSGNSPRVKLEQALLFSSFFPMLMIDNDANFLSDIMLMIAACGTPFVLHSAPADAKPKDDAKGDGKDSEIQLARTLEVHIAVAVVFMVSSGGVGVVNSILLALIMSGALKLAEIAYPSVSPFVASVPLLSRDSRIPFAVLELLIAKAVLYFIYLFIFPGDLFATQNGFFVEIIYFAIGVGVLFAGELLSNNDDKTASAKIGFSAAIVVSYVLLFLGYFVHELSAFSAVN